jgi:hypothetical protein
MDEEAECLTVPTLHFQHQLDVGCRFGHGVTIFKHSLPEKVAVKINHLYGLEQKSTRESARSQGCLSLRQMKSTDPSAR